MLHHCLRLSRTTLFLITGGVFLLGVVLSMLGGMWHVLSWPHARTMLTVGTGLCMIGGLVTVVWMTAVVIGLRNPRKPTVVHNRINLIIAVTALTVALVYPFYESVMSSFGGTTSGLALVTGSGVFGLFVLASYVLITYRAALALELREGYERTTIASRWGDWLLFIVQPIGVWKLQPRIRRLVTDRPATDLTDHLIADR